MALTRVLFASIAVLATLSACGGSTPGTPTPAATCGPPPPVPVPWLALAYPVPGTTNVKMSVGLLVFAGNTYDYYSNPATVSVSSTSGSNVPVGAYTAAPSPMPTPYATPASASGNIPYLAAPIGTLAPATAYTVRFTYADWNGVAPSCVGQFTQTIGSFTTQ